MARIAERGNPDGIVAAVEMPQWQPDEIELEASALVLVTDGIEIPGNLGTLIRTRADGPGRGQRTLRHHETLVSTRFQAGRRPHAGLCG